MRAQNPRFRFVSIFSELHYQLDGMVEITGSHSPFTISASIYYENSNYCNILFVSLWKSL